MKIGDHIKNVLIAFGDPHVDRVEIPVEGDPKNFYTRFFRAMRRKGQYWKLEIVLHVIRIRGER